MKLQLVRFYGYLQLLSLGKQCRQLGHTTMITTYLIQSSWASNCLLWIHLPYVSCKLGDSVISRTSASVLFAELRSVARACHETPWILRYFLLPQVTLGPQMIFRVYYTFRYILKKLQVRGIVSSYSDSHIQASSCSLRNPT